MVLPPVRLGFALGLLMLTYLFLIAVIDFEHRLVFILSTILLVYLSTWSSVLLPK